MESWQTLVATALVGTERQTPDPPNGEGALKDLVDQLDWGQPEGALLGAAGAIALHQQIGQCPSKKDWSPVEPCPLDDLPVIEPAIARHLDAIILNYSAYFEQEVLPELLSLIAQAGQRIPERLLPPLLKMGKEDSDLQPSLMMAVGKRGQWLAAQNLRWSFAKVGGVREFSPDSPQLQEIWANGRRDERILLLKLWRERDPDAAREALEKTWSKEKVKDRGDFIARLGVNLTMADEPFLEAALGDRSKDVREDVGRLLADLPESRLCQRMAERAQRFVKLTRNGGKLKIDITLPKKFEKEWGLDGMREEFISKQYQKKYWLQTMAAATPLDVWGEPSEAIAAIADSPSREKVGSSWVTAACKQRRADWAEAFLNSPEYPVLKEAWLGRLAFVLAPERQDQWIKELLPDKPKADEIVAWLTVITGHDQFWDLAFSKMLLAQLMALVGDGAPRDDDYDYCAY
ncbi:MAG: DUF5691 domain-containing protein, partial [Cyanobacteria bacterium P01_D01_bin.73]